MLHQAHGRRHIEKSTPTNSRIDEESQTVLQPLAYLTLQKIVQNYIRVGKIVVEISNRTLHGIRHIFYIDVSDRRQNIPVDRIRKVIKFTIGFFIGIDRINTLIYSLIVRAGGSTTRQQRCAYQQ